MSDQAFTTTERSDAQGENIAILWRFLSGLPGLRFALLPYLVLMILGTIAPQIFVWLTGEYSKCESFDACSLHLPWLEWNIELTPLLLALFAAAATIIRIAGWAIFEITGQWSARSIHARMIHAVAHTRTTFFDENPSGRLINRMIRDFENVRRDGVIRVGDSANALAEVLCASALVCIAHPAGALLVLPTIVGFFYIQRQVAPMLHRCASIRSVRFGEVLHRETDLIEGGRTFLLYGKERSLLMRVRSSLERFIQLHLLLARIEGWGRFWNTMVTALYAFVATLFVVAALSNDAITPLVAAVIMTVIYRLAPSFLWLTWVTSYLLETIATTRRVFEFVDLPDESSQEHAPHQPQGPARAKQAAPVLRGDIEFRDYSMSYRPDSPLILENLSLTLSFGSRIGIIGRTGAGKSSLVQSLYRMVHVQRGDILIGGQSIFSCPVHHVRDHFTVVPQDPYLFEGTIRSNIDRPGEFSDKEILRALEIVGMDISVHAPVREGGKNLSLGERQLVCLARVIVTKRPYVIMDEPTSGVDTITDARIQEVLATALFDRTVLTIAHRLDTLMRYDRVVELRDGAVLRSGAPHELLHSVSREALA